MSKQQHDCDVIIVGGGIVGLTLAAILAQVPHLGIKVFDQHPIQRQESLKKPYDLRVSAINHASRAIFQSLGLWQDMVALRISPYQKIQVWDANSSASIHFDCTEVGQADLGHIIEHSVMQQVLHLYLRQQSQVQLFESASVTELQMGREQVTLCANDGYHRAKLLIGADGSHSWVAQQAQLAIKTQPYSLSAVVTTVQLSKPHDYTAWQRFLSTGPLAFLPLADPFLASIVWSTTTEQANLLCQEEENAFNQALNTAIDHQFGTVQAIDQRLSFPLLQRHAQQYVKPRIALVGDAAHTIHPLAGQGVNLGLMDAACLAEIIQNTLAVQRDIGGLMPLRRYERSRKGDNLMMLTATAGFNQIFSRQQLIPRQLRQLGFTMTEKLPWLKTYFMKKAMGLAGELPTRAITHWSI